MKQLFFISTIVVLSVLFLSCEKPDGEAPTVTILTLQENDVVFEIVTISCIATDNEAVEKVELWLDGEYSGISDNTEPYKLEWNTTEYANRNYVVTIRAYDVNGKKSDSDPITLSVDNSIAYPQSIDIISIVYENGSFTITWNQSTDGDFSSYELEKSVESTLNYYEVVHTIDEVTDTTYVDTNIDPLIYQYYRITVIDTFGYATKGQIVSSSLDPVPISVNVTSVTYTLTEMTVKWRKSTDTDFKHYKLLYSETENGNKTTINVFTDINTTTYTTTVFDPTQENWFWIEVEDTLGQSSLGNGSTNDIDSLPTTSDIHTIIYENNSFNISWSKNNDTDFKSYTLHESYLKDMSNSTEIFKTNSSSETNFIVNGVNREYRYYQLVVEDVWGLMSGSNIQEGIPYIRFVKTFGGSNEDAGYSIQQTNDGGYILIGRTRSFGNGDWDFWLIKTDLNGVEEWNKTFGGSTYDSGFSVQQTNDGGYIVTGRTRSFGNGDWDVLLIKTDSGGVEEWTKTFGGIDYDSGSSVQQTNDGGFIITGWTKSFGAGKSAVWLIKTNSNGIEEWNKTYGCCEFYYGYSVQQTNDGGYILAGSEEPFYLSKNDVLLIKTNSLGNQEWRKSYGGSNGDSGSSVQQTNDGGYILTGHTESFGNGGSDVWLIKTNSSGIEEWNKTFGGSSSDSGSSVQQTNDGGYILTGGTRSFGNGDWDVLLIKTDSGGVEEWTKTFGGIDYDSGSSVQQTNDGGYILTGHTESFGNGSDDVWLIKTDPYGNTVPYDN